jgi:hypothetical protein
VEGASGGLDHGGNSDCGRFIEAGASEALMVAKGSTWERVIATVMGLEDFLLRCEEGAEEFHSV